MSTGARSFMITNRSAPTSVFGQEPIEGAGLLWFSASAANEEDYHAFTEASETPSAQAPSALTAAVVAELQAQDAPSLTVFVHGLDCYWSSAVKFTGMLGQGLAAAGYGGLVVGFSWPSNGSDDLLHYADAYPQAANTDSVRGRIQSSQDSFASFTTWLAELQAQVPGLSLQIVCHSEGNYLLMTALSGNTAPIFDQALLLAADINDGAFLEPDGADAGQGAGIVAAAEQVTVYFTRNDPTLAFSLGCFGASVGLVPGSGNYHNPRFGGRLGSTGPGYSAGAQQAGVVSVDCSSVLNDAQVLALGLSDSVGFGLHTSYFYVAQVLADLAQTMEGTAASGVSSRSPLSDPGAYVMVPTT